MFLSLCPHGPKRVYIGLPLLWDNKGRRRLRSSKESPKSKRKVTRESPKKKRKVTRI